MGREMECRLAWRVAAQKMNPLMRWNASVLHVGCTDDALLYKVLKGFGWDGYFIGIGPEIQQRHEGKLFLLKGSSQYRLAVNSSQVDVAFVLSDTCVGASLVAEMRRIAKQVVAVSDKELEVPPFDVRGTFNPGVELMWATSQPDYQPRKPGVKVSYRIGSAGPPLEAIR